MLKHTYKNVHYDSFIDTTEFLTYSCYIICICDYSNHKLVDIIYTIYIRVQYNFYHLRIVVMMSLNCRCMFAPAISWNIASQIHSQYCQYFRWLIYIYNFPYIYIMLHLLRDHSMLLSEPLHHGGWYHNLHIKSIIMVFISTM